MIQDGVNTGALTITNSIFTGNTVTGAGGAGGAIALIAQGIASGSTPTFSGTINLNTFIGNIANPTNGSGGAIYFSNAFSSSNTVQVHYNRFIGNTATLSTTNALAKTNGVGGVDASNNWWGCNNGPSTTTGCNNAAIIAGPGGLLNLLPFLQLKLTASPSTVCSGGTSTITASYLSNSISSVIAASNLTAMVGLPITFSATQGTLSNSQPSIQSTGTATVTFTSTSSTNATVNAVVDNVPNNDAVAQATITINSAPLVISQPTVSPNHTFCAGSTGSLSATFSGTPTPTYQWQISTDGGASFSNISGATSATLSLGTVTIGMNNNQYKCVATNTCGSATTNAATITVNTSPTVTTNPASQIVCANGTASFTAAFTGSPTPTVQWQQSTDGGASFTNISGATSSILSFTALAGQNNYQYRCVGSNSCNSTNTNAATLTVNSPPTISAPTVTQPTCATTTGTIVVNATGTGTLEYALNGGTYQTSNTFSLLTPNSYNITVRSQLASTCVSTYTSNPVVLVAATGCTIPTTTSASSSQNPSCFGKNVTFTATVIGGGNPVTSGTVTFMDGATVIASAVTLNGSGQATTTITTLSTGPHTITATYNGNVNFGISSGTYSETITANPAAISGPSAVCANTFITLLDATPGGTWSSNNGNATVGASTGIVTGVSAGSSTISYTVSGCAVSAPVTVTSSNISTTNATATTTISATNTYFVSSNCTLIANVIPSGAAPLSGTVTGSLTNDATVQVVTSNNLPYVQRHYDIVPATNAANATATITLYFTQVEFNAFNTFIGTNIYKLPTGPSDATGIAELRIYQYHGTGTAPVNYTGAGVSINPADNNIVWNATLNRWEITFDVVGFSGFYVSNNNAGNTILPLSWLNVTGNLNSQKQAVINWQVAEQNVMQYEVEKSLNANNFVVVGSIASKGNGTNSYSLTDAQILTGTGFYRIKQTDKNGKINYSNIVKLIATNSSFITIYPNPVSVGESLVLSIGNNKLHSWRIVDMLGRNMGGQEGLNFTGSMQVNIPSKIVSGMYQLILQTDQGIRTEKLIVK